MKTSSAHKPSATRSSAAIIYMCMAAAIVGAVSTGVYLLSEHSSAATSAGLQTATPLPNAQSERVLDQDNHAKHLELAMQAYSADKLIAPAGENALEHYLAALKSKPDDFGAQEAILELVPVAMTALETAMAANSKGEVERLILLLEQADPSAARVAALKKRWQENIALRANVIAPVNSVDADQMDAPALPVIAASAPDVRAARISDRPKQITGVAEAAANTPAFDASVASRLNTTIKAAQPGQSEPVAAVKQNHVVEARALSTARAVFPAQARRQKIEGWVDLQVVVAADGRVTEALVVGAQPSRIFDVEARRAVMRWRPSTICVELALALSPLSQAMPAWFHSLPSGSATTG